MSWSLGGTTIRSPHGKRVGLGAQLVVNRMLDGSYAQDSLGSRKKTFDCQWDPVTPADLTTILNAYIDQVENGTSYALVISEDGLSFSGNVLIAIQPYDLNIPNVYDHAQLQVVFTEV